jgi:hypothetical protein
MNPAAKLLALSIAAMATACASTPELPAGLVYQTASITVRIGAPPCAHDGIKAVISAVPQLAVRDFRQAVVVWKGESFAACWMLLDAATVLIVDETGDAGTIPRAQFKPETAV